MTPVRESKIQSMKQVWTDNHLMAPLSLTFAGQFLGQEMRMRQRLTNALVKDKVRGGTEREIGHH